jgi:parvulin-like peptidyl-prolyl isomerase
VSKPFLKTILREPLLHFLLLGAALFLFYQWKGSSSPRSTRIVVTSGEIEHLAAGFAGTWRRPPTEAELKGLIDEYVKEEMAAREATEMGLDQNDTIIRRRLRQKLEFLTDENLDTHPPADTELQAWLDRHVDKFRSEPQLAFRQVFLSTEKRGAKAQADAQGILAMLQAKNSSADVAQLSDQTMLPLEQPLAPLQQTAATFGNDFAKKLIKLEPGQWSGPIESPFGLHLVFVEKKVDGSIPKLAEVRAEVERDYLYDQRQSQLDALYQGLLKKYSVKIELPKTEQAANPARESSRQP